MDPLRLLLVDDETVFLKTLSDRLKKRGIPTMTADCGHRCLEILETHPMDVVVLDVKMPDRNGLEVLSDIKQSHPETEVIFLTGHGSTADGVEGIKAGAFDYLSKPVELDHLLKKIKQAHEKKTRDEEKKKEAENRIAMEKQLLASERLAALGVIASGVAHEINNPLAIIQGWSELMESLLRENDADCPHREEFEKGFDKINLAVKRAKQITRKMLGAIQKKSAEVFEINSENLLEKTVAMVKENALKKQVIIIQLPDSSHISFRADPYPVQQMLLNILDNAVQAAAPGGRVTCRIYSESENILFEIKDTGPGISPEHQDKIFDPFFTTKPTGEGTGLGLYMSRRIAEKHGGSIDVKSAPDQGAVFTVRLPLEPPAVD